MPNPVPTVIYHSADYDGLFCREIARKFLPDANLIGWDHGNIPIPIPSEGPIYILDLPVDSPFGFRWSGPDEYLSLFPWLSRVVWIDHHKSSIESHPANIRGYRIDGVAACRLAWQWFQMVDGNTREGYVGHGCPAIRPAAVLPMIQDYKKREVIEPLAVRLAGEYDVWDHRGDGDIDFQFGLDAQEKLHWEALLQTSPVHPQLGRSPLDGYAIGIISDGRAARRCYTKRDADIMRERSFLVKWEGLTFLALNTARCNSNTFAERDRPETGHDAIMAFFWNGREFSVSLYHALHRKDIDLSKIAVAHGGGGHPGACGFRTDVLDFIPCRQRRNPGDGQP